MLPDFTSAASDVAPILVAFALKGALLLAAALAVVSLMDRAAAASRHAVLATAMAAALVLPVLLVAVPAWQVPVLPAAGSDAPAAEVPTGVLPPALLTEAPAGLPPAVFLDPPSPLVAEATSSPGTPSLEQAATRSESGGTSGLLPGIGIEVPGLDRVEAAVAPLLGRTAALVPQSLRDWRVLLMLAWLLGVLIVAGRWVVAYVNARHLLEDAEPVADPVWQAQARRAARELGIDRQVRLLRSERLAVPVAWCFGRPAVVLPSDSEEWSAERREVVLLHEMAHVARYDGVTQVVAQAAVATHWFNPLAWMSHRRFLREREQACDDLVLARGTRASTYAEHLLEIGSRFRQEPLSMLAVAAMARNVELSDRIEAILDPGQRRSSVSKWGTLALAVAAAAVMIPLAAFSPTSAGTAVSDGDSVDAPADALGGQVVDDWRWEGRAAAGELVEVYALNGNVRVREGSGNVVRVEGTPRGRNARRARLEVNDVRGGVVICVVYEGQSGCEPGRGPTGRARNTNNASVNLDVVVPARVRLQARTTNGAIRADELSAAVDVRSTNGAIQAGSRTGDVRARTTNGAITLTAAGRVEAQTTNGSINARMSSTTWSGTSRLATTNGSVTVQLPRNADVAIDARTSTGAIRSDFDAVNVVRRRGPGATASGTIGRGGRQLEIRTTNGRISISRGSGSSSAAPPARDAVVAPAAAAAVSLADASWNAVDTTLVSADLGRMIEEVTAESMLLAQDVSALVTEALAGVDWEGITQEVATALEEVRHEKGMIGEEVRQALEEVQQELREARREIEEERRRVR